jgi:hypothetical protein
MASIEWLTFGETATPIAELRAIRKPMLLKGKTASTVQANAIAGGR